MEQNTEKVLFDEKSEFNTIVVTEDDAGLRSLWFGRDRVRQSVIKIGAANHLESPYARVVIAGLALLDRPRSILMVGLGGGVIPIFLRAHLPDLRIDNVEIDPVVVAAAVQFFGFREDDGMRVYVEDGRRFIERCGDRYDAIILDCAGVRGTPSHLSTREFLKRGRSALTPEGLLIANVWNWRANPYYDSMVATYKDVFESLYLAGVEGFGNQIFFAMPRRAHLTSSEVEARTRAFSEPHCFPFDLSAVVRNAFRSGDDEVTNGSVLRDPYTIS